METEKSEKKKRSFKRIIVTHRKKILIVSGVILMLAATFYAGTRYQYSRDKKHLTTARPNGLSQPPIPRTVSGKVDSVSDGKIVVVANGSKDKTEFKINKDTLITKSGKKANATDIKKDDSVRITPVTNDEKVARRISVVTAPTTPAPAVPKK